MIGRAGNDTYLLRNNGRVYVPDQVLEHLGLTPFVKIEDLEHTLLDVPICGVLQMNPALLQKTAEIQFSPAVLQQRRHIGPRDQRRESVSQLHALQVH